MTDVDAEAGFDRRALIRKGLVAGGIVATAPVISTFNAAAFASSVPGCHRKQYLVDGPTNGTITVTEQAPTIVSPASCFPASTSPTCAWGAQAIDTDPTISVVINQVADTVTWTLIGSYASCRWVAGSTVRSNGTVCVNPMLLSAGAFGTNTITWLKPDNQERIVRLLLFC